MARQAGSQPPSGETQATLNNIDAVKATGTEEHHIQRWTTLNQKVSEEYKRVIRWNSLTSGVQSGYTTIMLVLVVAAGLWLASGGQVALLRHTRTGRRAGTDRGPVALVRLPRKRCGVQRSRPPSQPRGEGGGVRPVGNWKIHPAVRPAEIERLLRAPQGGKYHLP